MSSVKKSGIFECFPISAIYQPRTAMYTADCITKLIWKPFRTTLNVFVNFP